MPSEASLAAKFTTQNAPAAARKRHQRAVKGVRKCDILKRAADFEQTLHKQLLAISDKLSPSLPGEPGVKVDTEELCALTRAWTEALAIVMKLRGTNDPTKKSSGEPKGQAPVNRPPSFVLPEPDSGQDGQSDQQTSV